MVTTGANINLALGLEKDSSVSTALADSGGNIINAVASVVSDLASKQAKENQAKQE